jgi:hypothetical protein
MQQPIAQPAGYIGEDIAAVFLGAQEDFVAVRPDEILRVLSAPGPLPVAARPADLTERVAGF